MVIGVSVSLDNASDAAEVLAREVKKFEMEAPLDESLNFLACLMNLCLSNCEAGGLQSG